MLIYYFGQVTTVHWVLSLIFALLDFFGDQESHNQFLFWQSAILGMHSIVSRPMVVGGNIVPRPMMYIALTYDHRLIDGREAVFFLRRIKDVVEDPRRLLLDI